MPFERDQRPHWHVERPQLGGAAEFRQVDDEAGGQHLSADLAQQLNSGLRSAARCHKVIDQDYALAHGHAVLVHFHFVHAVFERVSDADALVGQFALLADRHKPGRALVRDGAAQNEAARLDAGDLVDLVAGPGLHQLVYGAAERSGVAEQSGDIAEHDAGRWIVRNRPDRGAQVEFEFRRRHDDFPSLVCLPVGGRRRWRGALSSPRPRREGKDAAAPYAMALRWAGRQAPNSRPATASSFAISAGSRASGAVMMAVSRARSEPIGQGSCSRGKSRAKRTTRRLALSALAASTLMTSCTVTASWSGCQQSKSVTIATVA